MAVSGSQISQITPNCNKTSPSISQDLLQNHSLKLLCDVFSVDARPIRRSFFYDGQFFTRLLLLSAKHLKSHQIQTKII